MDVAVAMAGTATWALVLAAGSGDVRPPLVAAGILAALSFGLYPLAAPVYLGRAAAMGTLLCAYQLALAHAVARRGAMAQALVNCNIVVVCGYHIYAKTLLPTALLALLGITAVASAAALVLYSNELRQQTAQSTNVELAAAAATDPKLYP
jgi:hypothetical protein